MPYLPSFTAMAVAAAVPGTLLWGGRALGGLSAGDVLGDLVGLVVFAALSIAWEAPHLRPAPATIPLRRALGFVVLFVGFGLGVAAFHDLGSEVPDLLGIAAGVVYARRRARTRLAASAGPVGGPGAGGVLVEPLGEVKPLEHELDGSAQGGGRLAARQPHHRRSQ